MLKSATDSKIKNRGEHPMASWLAKRLTNQEFCHIFAASTEEALTASQVSEADTICLIHLEPTGAFTALFISPFEPPPPPLEPFVLIFNIPIAVCSRLAADEPVLPTSS